jgi:diguanylate cyclase (GGDEF)-like protein
MKPPGNRNAPIHGFGAFGYGAFMFGHGHMNFKNILSATANFWGSGSPPGSEGARRPPHAIERLLAKIPRRADAGRVLRSVLPECLAIICLLGMIWTSTGVIIWRERAHEMEEARGMTTALSKAFAETTARIVSEIDESLLNIRTSYAREGGDFDIQLWARKQIRDDQLRVQIAIMDKDGYVVRSTLERSNQGRINIADRPHFKYQLDPSRDELYISDPVVGRGSKERTIQFSRKLLDHDGNFSGVVVLSLSWDELSRFYATSGGYEGSVSIINERGAVIASGAAGGGDIGPIMTNPPPAMQMTDENSAWSLAATAWDSSHKGLVSYRKLRRYPLSIMITKSDREIYTGFWGTVRNFVVVSSLASLIVVLLGAFWISQRRRAVETAHALSVTLAGVTQGIVMVDFRGELSVVNQRARNLLHMPGPAPSDGDVMLAIDELVQTAAPVHEEPGRDTGSAEDDSQILESIRPDGQVIEIRTTLLSDGGLVRTLTDITEQYASQTRIRYLAHHDILTGLPNRVQLADRISAALSHALATGQMLMVMFIDLDGFKGVNDTLGHMLGDQLLIRVAEVVKTTIGPDDFVARLGGDEFTVIRSEVHDVGAALQLAPLLIDRIAAPTIIDGHEIRVSASIGVSVFPHDGVDYHVLFKNADIALYRAKNEGRATYRIFEPGMNEKLQRRMMLEEDLRAALDAGELQVHFQPQFESHSRRIVGLEALARWEHPKHGWISPTVFINVAEECSLINKLGALVLEQACHEAVAWPADCYVAVNVSAIQLLDTGFVDFVRDVLARTGLPASKLELELTETVMTDTSGQTMTALTAFRELGIRLALDDFGTGYSSLSNLLHLRFDKVKIDKSFVQEQHRDPKARAIVEAILAMSQHIGLLVTAEGVETETQLTMLRSQGCPLLQGNLLGWPITGEETIALLNGHRETRQEQAGLVF